MGISFVKSKDGERVDVFSGEALMGYIKKQRMGTHGHWHGWRHFPYCERRGECVWAGVACMVIYPEKDNKDPWAHWTDMPVWFANVKEFKEYWQNRISA